MATALGTSLGRLAGVQQFEDFTLDLRQQTTPESFQAGIGDEASEIALVLFDEFSVLDSIDGWDWISPFPRAHLAELVDALSAAGARTIGLDVYLDRLFPGLNAIDGGNDLLRDAIERAGNVILVAPVAPTDSGPVIAPPHPYFAEVAYGVGSAELPTARETFRDGTLAVRSGAALAPSFSLALFAHARGFDVDSLLTEAGARRRIALPGLDAKLGQIPEDWYRPNPRSASSIVPFRIRFVGPPSSADANEPPGTFQASASSSVALMAMLTPELFRDKIVLLGTGFHDEDKFRTPFYSYEPSPDPAGRFNVEPYGWMFGVEIHAHGLQNMLDGEYVTPLSAGGELLLLLVMALVTGGVAFRVGAGWGAVANLGAIGATFVIAWWAWAGVLYLPGVEVLTFDARFIWIPVTTPIISALLSYVGSVAYVSIVEGKEKRFIKGAFGKFLSPDVVEEISADPEALRLGGQKRPLSLLFSDLSGFTTLSEELDPESLIALLNEYLEGMTSIVLEEEGYLDKYIGDAIMAFWNAPKDVEDHAYRALKTAVAMQRRMDELNARWLGADPTTKPLKVRIGVHTGEVVVGNVGGKDRFDYSAIGDAVNLAARLEPANKTYDTLNMTSQTSLDEAGCDRFRTRELDLVAVVGKEEPIRVFELLEMAGVQLPEAKEEALQRYDEGMKAYKNHDWASARTYFLSALEACPDDGPSALYAGRCEQHCADPPPPDWDFVVRRTTK